VVINLIYGFTNPGVDNRGHVGGLLTGVVLGWFFAPEYQVVQPDPQQMPQVVDSSSPARWAVGVVLAGLCILLALIGGIIRWGG
jgi:rhomboid protease GluP